ncbi:uncharacterized protein [Macrobrachium rosenbergii]|uniref:uncharacterized protein n=1 Tax=Macrobrachium rosenbergii TaxID=79674 RepID=UPI0034D3D834
MHSLRKRLMKDDAYAKQYSTFMTEMLQKGYAERVTSASQENVWYIPHFGVQHPDKVRVVFDCASNVEGTSLNDLILQGPDMMNSLLGVLVKFRGGLFAYTGDINTMFYQVRVPEHQRDYLRFFWWENSFNEEPAEFRMAVHLFGACSSPSIANLVLKQTASDFGDGFSEGTRDTVANSFYVDDCLRAKDRQDALLSDLFEVKELCKRGGFTLTKYSSPCEEVLSSIPKEWHSKGISGFVDGSGSHKTKALGVQWDLATDELGVQAELVSVPRTKRGLLPTIASIYDPLGILAPVLIEGRIIVQDLCRLKVGWDMELDSDTTDRIRVWVNKLSQTRGMSVPRCLKVIGWESATLVQLHLFSDASIMAVGVAAYLRVADQWGNVSCRFIMGKARVAPLKNISVPRLELSAAVLAVKLGTTILDMIDFKVDDVYYWTDSTTVLRYIKNDQARYQTFVANCVSMIRDGSDQNEWRYVN